MRTKIIGLAALIVCLPSIGRATPETNNTQAPESLVFSIQADPELGDFVTAIIGVNPRVKAAAAAVAASAAMASAAGRPLYNPELELGYENSIENTWDVGIGQSFDWGGKRQARTSVATAARQAVSAQHQVVQREVTVELLTALNAYQIAFERDNLATRRAQIMQEFSNLAENRFQAGDLNQVEADLATLASLEAQIQRASTAADLAEARQGVRALGVNSDASSWPPLSTELPVLPNIKDPQRLVINLPEVLVARNRAAAASAMVELRQREKRPDPRVSLRAGQEANTTLFGVNLSIPLYVRNSFTHQVTAAVAEMSQAQQLADDLLRRAYSRYLSAAERYQLSSRAWSNWQKTGQVSLERQGDLLKRMWEAGELSTTDYLVQLKQTLDTRDSALDLNLRMWRAWFEWLAASGQVNTWLGENSPGETSS